MQAILHPALLDVSPYCLPSQQPVASAVNLYSYRPIKNRSTLHRLLFVWQPGWRCTGLFVVATYHAIHSIYPVQLLQQSCYSCAQSQAIAQNEQWLPARETCSRQNLDEVAKLPHLSSSCSLKHNVRARPQSSKPL